MANNVYIGNRYVPLLKGAWDITQTYERLMIVHANDKGYISVNNVPAGADINDASYWMLLYNNLINITQLDWVDVLNKPTTFPPAVHTHTIGDVVGLTNSLSNITNVNESQDTRLTEIETALPNIQASRSGVLAYGARLSKGNTTQTATGGTDTVLLFNKSEQAFGNSISVTLPTTSNPLMQVQAPTGIAFALFLSASLYVYTAIPDNNPSYITLSLGGTTIAQHGRQQYVSSPGSTIPTASSYEISDTYMGNVFNGSEFSFTFTGKNGQVLQGITGGASYTTAISIKLFRVTA